MQPASPTVIDLQLATAATAIPAASDFQDWAEAALREAGFAGAVEITVRVVDAEESQALNREYRDKDKPTNVLSFTNDLPEFLRKQLDVLPLGDLVICAPIVASEATEQRKKVSEHWAHLTVHGVLHLLGFDHIDDDDAEVMEAKEIAALKELGIGSPYKADE